MSRLILKFWKKGGREFAMHIGVAGTQEVAFYCTRFYFPINSVFFVLAVAYLSLIASSHGTRRPLQPGRRRALAGGSMLVC